MNKLTKQQEENQRKFEEREKRLVKKLYWQDAEDTGKDSPMVGRLYRITTDPRDGYSYESDEIVIEVHKDGAINFTDDYIENWIYFYPDQLKYLEKALKLAKKQAKLTLDK